MIYIVINIGNSNQICAFIKLRIDKEHIVGRNSIIVTLGVLYIIYIYQPNLNYILFIRNKVHKPDCGKTRLRGYRQLPDLLREVRTSGLPLQLSTFKAELKQAVCSSQTNLPVAG